MDKVVMKVEQPMDRPFQTREVDLLCTPAYVNSLGKTVHI